MFSAYFSLRFLPTLIRHMLLPLIFASFRLMLIRPLMLLPYMLLIFAADAAAVAMPLRCPALLIILFDTPCAFSQTRRCARCLRARGAMICHARRYARAARL